MGKVLILLRAPVLPSAADESLPLPVNCETPSVKKKIWYQMKQV